MFHVNTEKENHPEIFNSQSTRRFSLIFSKSNLIDKDPFCTKQVNYYIPKKYHQLYTTKIERLFFHGWSQCDGFYQQRVINDNFNAVSFRQIQVLLISST